MSTSPAWNIPATDHALCGRWPMKVLSSSLAENYPCVCPFQLNTAACDWYNPALWNKAIQIATIKAILFLASKCLYVSHREYNFAVWRLAGKQKLTFCVVDSVQVTRGAWRTAVSFLLSHARAWDSRTTHNQGSIYDLDFGGKLYKRHLGGSGGMPSRKFDYMKCIRMQSESYNHA